MTEHQRIQAFFAPLTHGEPGALHLHDDAALLTPPAGATLVITTDSVIDGVHLLHDSAPQHVAQKLMRRNLSDLAAMGATPWRYTLNLHSPRDLPEAWLAEFADALRKEQETFGLILVGGDSTVGHKPLHATLTCIGLIEGAALHRAHARAGDDLYVSGTLGDAAAALTLLQHQHPCDAALHARYVAPTPRLELGQTLRNIATAAIDISDGLLADLAQLCAASGVAATLQQSALPRSQALQQSGIDEPTQWLCVLSGGDDYELLFTAPPTQRDRINTVAQTLNLPLTRIGHIHTGAGITVYDTAGKPIPITRTGYVHG